MMTTEAEVPQRGTVRTQLVSGHPLRREALFPQQLAHEFDGRAAVAPSLKQHVEDLAFVVNRAPEIHPFDGDTNHHLVQGPTISRSGTAPPQPALNHWSEFQHRIADALVGEVEPTLRKQLLDVAIAQGEAQVEPNRVLNHGRREPVPAIRDRKHGSQPTAGRQLWPKLS